MCICVEDSQSYQCSEYGWSTVCHYHSDTLASDSKDEKELHRVEKDTKKDFEQLEVNKQWQGGGGVVTRGGASAYHPYTNCQ